MWDVVNSHHKNNDDEDDDDPRNWYLDAKSFTERNKQLIELHKRWEECFKVGKFNYSLISSLRYWSYTPDRETIMLAILDTYQDIQACTKLRFRIESNLFAEVYSRLQMG